MSTTANTQHQSEGVAGNIAVGVPVFSRTDALRNLLESTPAYVETVYVADNGHTEERAGLYDESWPFELEVIDVEYDAGIGPCRHAINQEVTEPYLWIGDCDMEFLREDDLRQLRRVLEAHPELGAVSGWLREGDTIRSGARNLVERDDVIYKTVRDTRPVEGEPLPFARFDMIPQCGVFRTEIFDDYDYDPEVFNSEHIDFFWGHHERTEWEFASTPAVVIAHHRNIDPEYRQSKRGNNHVDLELMQDKWGIDYIQIGARPDWVTTRERNTVEQAFDVFRRVAPPKLWGPVRRVVKGVAP